MTPAIFGLSGLTLTPDEIAFFKDANPAGYIVFKRNCETRAQLRGLTDSLRALHGRDDLAIMMDQEGGRVARMQPPEWPAFPAPGLFELLYERAPLSALEAARANAKAIGLMLCEAGVTVNAMPLLDIRYEHTHSSIGDRALATDPYRVASLGRAVLDGLREGGVVGVVKHMPGQGRAKVDSHDSLPIVEASDADLAHDILAFERLRDAPMGMTGHVVFTAWDKARCATVSPVIIGDIIRGRIGFQGLLMSDDLDMKALQGHVADRSLNAIAAGCDVVLHCSGQMDDRVAIARALPSMTAAARDRLDAGMSNIGDAGDAKEVADLIAKRDALLAIL